MTDCIIPEGYKKTSLGVIPKEWEAVSIHEICTLVNGRAYKQNELLSEGKYKILRVGNFFTNDSWYFSDLELEANKYACKGDLLYAWSASFGPRFWTEEKVICHYRIWKICDLKGVDKQYLYFFLDYDASLLQNAIQGGTMHHITKNDMEKRFIPLPPMEEQQNIAKVLNSWDKAIEKQTQLIEKLELRKKGLMQQLLTGKKRLPGFGGEWKNIAIKDFAIEVSLKNNRNENWEVLSCTKYDGLVPSLQYFGRQVFSKDITQYKIVPQYCFAYATNHIEEGSIGYQSIYKNSLISPMYTVFKTDSNMIDDIFLYKLLKSHRAIYLYNVMMEGSIDRRGGLRWDNFSTIKFLLPDIKEQSAIADILVSCDNEILLAKQKLNKFRQQKKGLMQVLLTGKKRVNI